MKRVLGALAIVAALGLLGLGVWMMDQPSEQEMVRERARLEAAKKRVGPRYREVRPYGIEIIVGDMRLPQVEHGGDIWVEGVPGEEYSILLTSPDGCESWASYGSASAEPTSATRSTTQTIPIGMSA